MAVIGADDGHSRRTALSVLVPISTDIYLPGLPSIGRDLSATTSATQATLSSCLVGLAVGQVVAEPANDVLGPPPSAAGRDRRLCRFESVLRGSPATWDC